MEKYIQMLGDKQAHAAGMIDQGRCEGRAEWEVGDASSFFDSHMYL